MLYRILSSLSSTRDAAAFLRVSLAFFSFSYLNLE